MLLKEKKLLQAGGKPAFASAAVDNSGQPTPNAKQTTRKAHLLPKLEARGGERVGR